MKFDFYCIKVWEDSLKQLCLFPSLVFTYHSHGSVKEEGIYGWEIGFGIDFLCWNTGIRISR